MVKLRRRSRYYSQNLLVPCILISMLSPFTFLLPGLIKLSFCTKQKFYLADSGEKISLGVTILLSLTVFQLIVAEQMPPSEDIPIIGLSDIFIFHEHLFLQANFTCIQWHLSAHLYWLRSAFFRLDYNISIKSVFNSHAVGVRYCVGCRKGLVSAFQFQKVTKFLIKKQDFLQD